MVDKKENTPEIQCMDKKKICGITLTGVITVAVIFYLIYFLMSMPVRFKNENVSCKYDSKEDKIICTQMSDVVPEWYTINKALITTDLVLVFKRDAERYEVLKMSDATLIPGLNRKFVFERKNQSLSDYVKFKNFARKSTVSGWGPLAFYCSEKTANEPVCKIMRKAPLK